MRNDDKYILFVKESLKLIYDIALKEIENDKNIKCQEKPLFHEYLKGRIMGFCEVLTIFRDTANAKLLPYSHFGLEKINFNVFGFDGNITQYVVENDMLLTETDSKFYYEAVIGEINDLIREQKELTSNDSYNEGIIHSTNLCMSILKHQMKCFSVEI